MKTVVRNPYIVGQWVQGRNHYGRQRLIEHLLEGPDSATWVIGTRRIGKTSLLRQLEWITTDRPDSQYVPLFWDMQGSESIDDLAYELYFSVEEHAERFLPYQIDIGALEGLEPLYLLRMLLRGLERHNRRLLLLIDEAEALVQIARNEPAKLAGLRKVIQDQRLRTVMTSTKLLAQLNDVSREWLTSAFLFGFNMVNLWSLDREAAQSLIGQEQSPIRVSAGSRTVEDILAHTNCHPYLIQHLCHALFQNGEEGPFLRPVRDELLIPNQLLAGFFEIDFEHLTTVERQILLLVADRTVVDQKELLRSLPDHAPGKVQNFLYAMTKLGYLRQLYGRWAVGNEFLRRWLVQNYGALSGQVESNLSDQDLGKLIALGRDRELALLTQEMAALTENLAKLEQRAPGAPAPDPAADPEIRDLRSRIQELQREIDLATSW